MPSTGTRNLWNNFKEVSLINGLCVDNVFCADSALCVDNALCVDSALCAHPVYLYFPKSLAHIYPQISLISTPY